MPIRDDVADWIDDADVYTPEKPVATVAELSEEVLELPIHVVRACAVRSGLGVKVGNVLCFTREQALDLAEELDGDGWVVGPETDDEPDDEDDLEDDEEEDLDDEE